MADDTEGVDAADINGDGYLDLVFAPWYGYIEIWYNDGLGTFLPGDTLFEAGQIFLIDIELRDVNYDNLPDILTDTYVLENNPANPGTFTVTSNYLTGSTHDFESADINNDGFLDIYKGRFSSNDGDLVYFYQPGTLLYSDTTLCYGDSLLIAGTWQTEPGEYIGSVGCDSNMVVDLAFYAELNTDVMLMGHTLTSLAIGVYYQWIDCVDSSFIEGAVEQSFTPEVTGDYAVILMDGPCSEMSECYNVVITGVDELTEDNIMLYPNPNNGGFVLKTGEHKGKVSLDIADVMGNLVYQSNEVGQNTRVDLIDCPPGVYILTLRAGNSVVIKRIIKQ
jgi:hypothetical protein